MKKFSFIIVLGLVAALLAGCALDVIATDSAKALERIIAAVPNGAQATDEALTIPAPDGAAAFVLLSDWSGDMDVYLLVDLAPLIQAGLDPSRLPAGYAVDGEKLLVGRDLGGGAISGDTPTARYEALVARRPDALGFHSAMGHFGIGLMGGMYEWTRDLTESDKDVVFVLDPAPLIEAGLDPEAVEGWVYAQIETMDSYGAKVMVWKLLRPYDL